MSHSTLRIKLSIVFSMIALMAFSQRQDTVLHNYYKVGKEATLNIDFQHTELSIIPSENDSIAIHTRIRVIPSNPHAPYAGIILKTEQKNTNDVSTSIRIGEAIEPHNNLESSCEIHVPKGVHLKLNSHYGIIHLNAPLGNIKALLAYSNLTADTLTTSDSINFTADYSSIIFGDMKGKISIEGKNINFKAKNINKLTTKTEFSVFNITSAETVKSQSYTDKFILGDINSMHINSKKSLCLINNLHQFFQGEMKNGLLTLNEISQGFEAINISNTHVTTQLNFSTNCYFSINADMRYCLLKQEQLTLQETVSPNSVLYSGNYGNSTHKISKLSIISAYGDVTILVK
ncbi:MAG: hypothetical protein PF444_01305 [Bacteroidales bacterium]|nr:hypothetical protein [Bacteroidales bacterium]